jgi:hypothetical protein
VSSVGDRAPSSCGVHCTDTKQNLETGILLADAENQMMQFPGPR